jgi:hypothetical protein
MIWASGRWRRVVVMVPLVLCGCRPHARLVAGPPEMTVALTQRQGADPGCTATVPDTQVVRARQPFAFENRTSVPIVVAENEANIFLDTIAPGHVSRTRAIEKPQDYAYFTFWPERRTTPARACPLKFLRVNR